jgi:hypothetical protein
MESGRLNSVRWRETGKRQTGGRRDAGGEGGGGGGRRAVSFSL